MKESEAASYAEDICSYVETRCRESLDERLRALRREYRMTRDQEEAFVRGWTEGWRKGYAEGLKLGRLMGRIQLAQKILGLPVESTKSLTERSFDELEAEERLLTDLVIPRENSE